MVKDPNEAAAQPEPLQPDAAHPRTAVFWMGAAVLGVALAAFMADRDSLNRAQIEQAVERTAVGDRAFFPLTGSPVLSFEGKPLVLANEPEAKPESGMLVGGSLDGLPYRLYIPMERRIPSNGGGDALVWWVKTGPGQFLKVSR